MPHPQRYENDDTQSFEKKLHLGRPSAFHWLRFESDMQKIGLTVHEAHGPNGWGGPAVTVPSTMQHKIRSATRVTLDSHECLPAAMMFYPSTVIR